VKTSPIWRGCSASSRLIYSPPGLVGSRVVLWQESNYNSLPIKSWEPDEKDLVILHQRLTIRHLPTIAADDRGN
jgi:hypothetical protein